MITIGPAIGPPTQCGHKLSQRMGRSRHARVESKVYKRTALDCYAQLGSGLFSVWRVKKSDCDWGQSLWNAHFETCTEQRKWFPLRRPAARCTYLWVCITPPSSPTSTVVKPEEEVVEIMTVQVIGWRGTGQKCTSLMKQAAQSF